MNIFLESDTVNCPFSWHNLIHTWNAMKSPDNSQKVIIRRILYPENTYQASNSRLSFILFAFSSFGKRHATGASSAKRTTHTWLHSTSDRGRICCRPGLYNIRNYFRGNPCFFSNSTKLSILDYSKELRRCRPRHTLDKLTSLQNEPRST